MRSVPNILITGTPGTGKTTLSELLEIATGFKHINCSELVKEKKLHDGYDEEFDTYILNDDKLNDELEEIMEDGGKIVDFHSSDMFPERFFDLVVVLQTDNGVLYKRLEKRNNLEIIKLFSGYSQKKITENIECEIMQVVLEEASEAYKPEILVKLNSNNIEEMESNVERIQEWISEYMKNNSN
ncbi:P-loop containing nucleoside triphosphate hydrolase protein [Neoconidiobolus thromboides FSU 785]|nr:P-loop containing nucleoside triphosphate hydrolase protein [Neoconidiobolus thromboides FSU 785]